MQIGMVCPYSFDEPGGVQIHAIELCQELQRRGHSVSLLGPGENPSYDLPDFVELGGSSIPIRYNGSVARLSFGPKTIRHIKRWINAHDFDVMHIHEPNSPSYSMLALRLCEGPIVATYHASASQSRLLSFALPFLRPMLEKIHGGIAVSEEARRWQVENLSGDPVLIPNGVETRLYRDASPLEELDTHRPRVMFLGRFEESRKGLGILIEAIPDIVASIPNVEILIAGGGDVYALSDQLHNKGISSVIGFQDSAATVRIVGRISDESKAAALVASDVYCAPNTGGESFGIVLVEAMAAGAAIVASDLPAFSAVTHNGQVGCLFPSKDSSALANSITTLLQNDAQRRHFVLRGQERVKDFDWSTVATRVELVYSAVAHEGRKVRLS